MTEIQSLMLSICCGYIGGQIVYFIISLVSMIVDAVKAKRNKKQ